MIPSPIATLQVATPFVLPAAGIALDAQSHLATIDAICAQLLVQFAPSTIINPLRAASLLVDGDLKTSSNPTETHLNELNDAIRVAGQWLYSATPLITYDAVEIKRTRTILKDALRSASTPTLSVQINRAIQTATGLLLRQTATTDEITTWQAQSAAALAAVGQSIFVVAEVQ